MGLPGYRVFNSKPRRLILGCCFNQGVTANLTQRQGLNCHLNVNKINALTIKD